MNILKTKNKRSGKIVKIEFETPQQLAKARTTIMRLQGFKSFVPCDVESGKDRKLFSFKNWELVN